MDLATAMDHIGRGEYGAFLQAIGPWDESVSVPLPDCPHQSGRSVWFARKGQTVIVIYPPNAHTGAGEQVFTVPFVGPDEAAQAFRDMIDGTAGILAGAMLDVSPMPDSGTFYV